MDQEAPLKFAAAVLPPSHGQLVSSMQSYLEDSTGRASSVLQSELWDVCLSFLKQKDDLERASEGIREAVRDSQCPPAEAMQNEKVVAAIAARDGAFEVCLSSARAFISSLDADTAEKVDERKRLISSTLPSVSALVRELEASSQAASAACTDAEAFNCASFLAEMNGALDKHEAWVREWMGSAVALRSGTECARASLESAVRDFANTLGHTALEGPSAVGIDACLLDVRACTAREQDLEQEGRQAYDRELKQPIVSAGYEMIRGLEVESTRIELLARAREEATLMLSASGAGDRVLAELKRVTKEVQQCSLEHLRAGHSAADLEMQDKFDPVAEEKKAEVSSKLRETRKRLQDQHEQQRLVWRQLYSLAAGLFPELPVTAWNQNLMGQFSQDLEGGKLFAPHRSLQHYSDVKPIGIASSDDSHSRNEVFECEFGGKRVVLKKFKNLLRGSGLQTLQSEINTLTRMSHPNLISADLFFLEEHVSSLCAYVQYPYYSGGNMRWWLKTDVPRTHLILQGLLDVLKGLEYVHCCGIIHCDVKLENVLMGERYNELGARKAVLADFDLSLDQAARQKRMPTVAQSSMSSRTGPRGTAGFLTMAPEIFEGKEPTQKSDMFSYGGMLFEALRPKLAVQWSHPLFHHRYDDSGRFRLPALASGAAEETVDLSHVPEIKTEVDRFVSALMHQDPHRRPTATLALEDPLFFRNQGLGEEYVLRLEEIEKDRLRLQLRESEFEEMVEQREKKLAEQEAKCREDAGALRREREQMEAKYQKPRQTLLEKDKRLGDELQGLVAKREEISLHQQQELDALESRESELESESKALGDQSKDVDAKLLDLETKTRALEQDKQKLEFEIESTRLHLQHQEAAVIKQRSDMELQQQADSSVKRKLQEEEDRLRDEKRKQEAEFEAKLLSLQLSMSEESERRCHEEGRLRSEQARIAEQRRAVEQRLEAERREIARERLQLDNEVQQLNRKQLSIQRQRDDLQKQESKLAAAELLTRRRQEKTAAELRIREKDLRAKRVAEEERLSLQRVELELVADEVKRQRAEIAKNARVPDHWQEKSHFNLARNDYMKPFMQKWMRASDCGTACGHNLRNLKVTRVERVENAPLWSTYVSTKEMLQKVLRSHTAAVPKLSGHVHTAFPVPPFPVLDSSVNEFLVFHGTSQSNIKTIAQFGCDHRLAKLEGLYGGGSYFADQACKSCQYNGTTTVESAILVCRVMMGWPHLTRNPAGEKSLRRPPDNAATPGRCFDSIFAQKGVARGGGQAHNELVVFDRGQIYVEYIVYFTV